MNTTINPWAPYVPSPDDPWDLRKVAHLHRRAGFGASWSELERDLAAGPAKAIDRLLHPDAESPQFRQVAGALKRSATPSGDGVFTTGAERAAQAWWLYRMTYGPDPLGEKLTLFWHDHFATGLHGVYDLRLMLDQNGLFREHARGNFGDLLRAVEADRAMLVWLDGGSNQKEHPNENFARELLELFTLGPGHYTETDVREVARALTGWTAPRDNLLRRTTEFYYDEELADRGTKTILGQTGQWRRDDVFRIILEQPASARHLCRRLYRWFMREDSEPSDELIEPLATELRASNYSIDHVVGIMLRSRHFFSPAVYRARVKSPVEFCVGTIRQLEPPRTPNLLHLAAVNCERQGQILFDPPSVKGWEGGQAWLNSNATLMRLNWIGELLGGQPQAQLPGYDPQDWLDKYSIDASEATEKFSRLLLDGVVRSAASAVNQKDAHADRQPDWQGVLQLLLQTPEYQLA